MEHTQKPLFRCSARRISDTNRIAVLAYIANLFDTIFTLFLYARYGSSMELNPIGVWMLDSGMVIPVKIVLTGLLLWFVAKVAETSKIAKNGLYVVFGAYSLLTVWHLIVYGIEMYASCIF